MKYYVRCRNCGAKLTHHDWKEGFCSLSCEMGLKELELCDDCGKPVEEHRRVARDRFTLVLCPGDLLPGEPVPVSDSEDRDE